MKWTMGLHIGGAGRKSEKAPCRPWANNQKGNPDQHMFFNKFKIAKRESLLTTKLFHSAKIRPQAVPEQRSGSFFAFGFAMWLAASLLVGIAGAASLPQAPIQPIENSDIVSKGPDGVPGVMKKDGTPINGLKLSQHDSLVLSPNIAVASDGAIHVAFIERQVESPFSLFVYHRESTDGGRTWSEAKNLSEDMPNFPVGYCHLLVDGKDRIYVTWRAGLSELLPPREGDNVNLVYRVLDHGKWSKIIAVNPPGSASTQNNGSIFSFTTTDAAGQVQAVWNACPDTFLPGTTVNGMHLGGVGNGLVFAATLDGSTPSAPRQVFMAQVTTNESLGDYGKMCDDFSDLDGYADATGAPHFIAMVRAVRGAESGSQVELFEDGKHTPAIKLPTGSLETWTTPPKLLVDARGNRHIIAFYKAGEHPAFRDYVVGSDEDPTVILAAKSPGTCLGFQAYQGPGGHMAVVMQTTERGYIDSGESWVSVSDGGKWSPAVCVTGNAARASYVASQKGANLLVGTGDHYGPGPGAVAFDNDGHLLLALVNVKTGTFGLTAGGITYAGGSAQSPMLCFYKF